MKYGWQIKEIEDKLSKLPDKELSTHYENVSRLVYEEMLSDYSGKIGVMHSDNAKTDFIKAVQEFDFNDINSNHLNVAIYLGEIFKELEFEMPSIQLPNYGLEEIVDISKVYMRRKESGNNYLFKKIISNPKRLHIKFNQSIYNFLGKSYILSDSEFYVLINGINGVQDTVSFLHESGHIEDFFRKKESLPLRYLELASLTREHYAFDFMRGIENEEDVEKARKVSLYHYLARIIRLYNTIMLVMTLNSDQEYFASVLDEHEKKKLNINMTGITGILQSNFEEELMYITSFIASLDIYLNCLQEEAPMFVSMYQMGKRDVTVKVIDRIIPYLCDVFSYKPNVKSI
jgi:hypothetical protein